MNKNKNNSIGIKNGTISSFLYGNQMPQNKITFFDRCIHGDVKAFLDYSLIKKLAQSGDLLAIEMDKSIKSYNSILFDLIKSNNILSVDKWLKPLKETKFTGIGYSTGEDGNGVGEVIAESLRNSLVSIKNLIAKGNNSFFILPLTIDNIGNDRSSDIVTAITKLSLIDFTENLTSQNGWDSKIVRIDNAYDPKNKKWITVNANLPLINGKPAILYPKQFINTSSSIKSTFNSFWRYLFKNYIRFDDKYISYRTNDRNYITINQFKEIVIKEGYSYKSYIRNYALKDYALIDKFESKLDNVIQLTDQELEALQYCRITKVA